MTAPLSDKQRQVIAAVRKAGFVDFKKVGEIVATVTPQLFDGDIAADDYVVKGVDSVLHVWKLPDANLGLEEISRLSAMTAQVKTLSTE